MYNAVVVMLYAAMIDVSGARPALIKGGAGSR
jgi:hypothetical protein